MFVELISRGLKVEVKGKRLTKYSVQQGRQIPGRFPCRKKIGVRLSQHTRYLSLLWTDRAGLKRFECPSLFVY